MTNATADPTTEEAKQERDFHMIAVTVPLDLHSALEESAKESKVSVGTLTRRFIAQAMGWDITAFEKSRRRGRVKYGSPEEAAAAAKAAQRERAAVVRALMERYQSGAITLSADEIKAAEAKVATRNTNPKAETAKASK